MSTLLSVPARPAEQFTDPIADHGEGPVWFAAEGLLRMVDMLAGDVITISPQGALLHREHVGTVAAAIRPRSSGGYVVATERDLRVIGDSGETHSFGPAFDDPAIRFNEGGCTPDGAFLCGTMAYANTPSAGTLYRLEPGGAVSVALSGVTISNGLSFTADGTTMFYTDSATGRVDIFDYVGGDLRDRQPFAVVDREDGAPDGLCVDAEGGVWVALWGGGEVRRYDADGRVDDIVTVPVAQVTACTLGGADLTQLFITTSRYGMSDPEPLAGAVFRVDVDIPGTDVLTFAG
ncbi:SMP-30/gluconolactonase/LRE family protein [Leifsonia sp. AG29]|uniref:SMP-30/gluconolactonase/LRE family protein n=1 Tax=Leifsonia sp. AG29 TaxID=2598860 RepID=UPI001E3BE06F|nr:SMP-30/gluconolactonase/LRE family protein [Leifsonia sp. AG29]